MSTGKAAGPGARGLPVPSRRSHVDSTEATLDKTLGRTVGCFAAPPAFHWVGRGRHHLMPGKEGPACRWPQQAPPRHTEAKQVSPGSWEFANLISAISCWACHSAGAPAALRGGRRLSS